MVLVPIAHQFRAYCASAKADRHIIQVSGRDEGRRSVALFRQREALFHAGDEIYAGSKT